MTPTGGPRRTVLVVDDEFDIRYVTRLLLEGAGYGVVEASDGRAALDLLDTEPVDLVLTDVDMPGMDGLTLLARLRTAAPTADLPVIVWSERHHDHLDATATLTKGVGVHDLVGQVDRIMEGDH